MDLFDHILRPQVSVRCRSIMLKGATGWLLLTVYNRHFVAGVIFGYLIATTKIILLSDDHHQVSVLNNRTNSPGITDQLRVSPHNDQQVTNKSDQSSDGNLMNKDRILCWIVTSPLTKSRAQMVKKTWGQRCDKLLFMSSENDTSLPAVGLPIPGSESRFQLWNKAKLTFQHVYDNYLNDYDWFYKADDDTYTIVENLRFLLANYNSSLPYFLGRKLRYQSYYTFLSGGAGYAMSRETLRRLVEISLKNSYCPEHFPGEVDDVTLGLCLQRAGVIMADTRDLLGHQRFIPFRIEEFFSGQGNNMSYMRDNDFYSTQFGSDCCSDVAISFHYVSDYTMQLYDYLIYKLQVINSFNGPLRRIFNSILLLQ